MLTSYGFGTTLEHATFEDAVARVTEALREQGFGVLTEIDVKRTLKEKIDVDHRSYVILGACHPHLAHRAIGAEPHVGLLLPCNVVVQKRPSGTGIDVSFADPKAMFTFVDNPALAPIADEAERKLRLVLADIES